MNELVEMMLFKKWKDNIITKSTAFYLKDFKCITEAMGSYLQFYETK
jgi:hypothetical protein